MESRISRHYPADDSLAMMEMRVTLTRLMWNFDLALKDGQEEPVYDHKSLSAGQLLLNVQRRKSN